MNALSVLNQRWVEAGFTRKPVAVHLLQLAAHVAFALGGTALYFLVPGLAAKALGLLVSSYGMIGISTHAHTSSHNAIFDATAPNRALVHLGFPFLCGVSALYWWNKHVHVHHPTPNVVGLDDDIDLMPFFALTREEAERGGPLLKLWFRVQGIAIVPILALNCFNIQKTGWSYWVRTLRGPGAKRGAHALDLALLLGHYVFWIGLPALFFPLGEVAFFYVVRMFLLGYGMFAVFAPAHFPARASFVSSEGEANRLAYKKSKDFVLLQTATTVNFRTGPVGRLLCLGVEYQIEHHLFPGISHVHYPRLSVELKRFCEENGYPYRTLGWWEGILESIRAFRHLKPVEPRLEELRPQAEGQAA